MGESIWPIPVILAAFSEATAGMFVDRTEENFEIGCEGFDNSFRINNIAIFLLKW